MNPSRYPIAPCWLAARQMSLYHKVQFILSNLSFSTNVGVSPVNDIVVFCTRGVEANDLLNKVSQELPIKVDN